MNGTNATISKKVMPLVAVLILCAACLVTVAYAYNASYKDAISGEDVTPVENSKYIYITGDGLSYPDSTINAIVDVQYDTVTEKVNNEFVTKAVPTEYTLVNLTSPDATKPVTLSADGIATIKIGEVTIHNKNADIQKAYISVAGVLQSDLPEEKVSFFQNKLTSSNIYLKTADSETYSNIFVLSNNKATVEVYVVAKITELDNSYFTNENRTVEDGTLSGQIETALFVPGFSLSFAATQGDDLVVKTGEIAADEISDIKTDAAANAKVTLKVVNDNGAAITMDSAAISTLGANAAALEVTEATAPEGVSAAYEVTFGDNHFGNNSILTITLPYTLKEGETAENISIAYIKDGVVDSVYTASYSEVYGQGYVTFNTNHLSTYGVVNNTDYAVTLALNGITTQFKTVAEAVAAVPTTEVQATISLSSDLTGSGVKVQAGQNIVFNLNGHKYTVVNPTVGSPGTETNAFQMLKGSTVKFYNGELYSTAARIFLQNYCDLTLDKVKVSKSTAGDYLVSNNCGSFTMIDSELAATGTQIAFDVWYGMSNVYDDGVTVNIVSGTVTGNVEYGAANRVKDIENWEDNASLTISQDVVFNGKILPSNGNDLTKANVNLPTGWSITATEITPVAA